jgi:hypothetical protein
LLGRAIPFLEITMPTSTVRTTVRRTVTKTITLPSEELAMLLRQHFSFGDNAEVEFSVSSAGYFRGVSITENDTTEEDVTDG